MITLTEMIVMTVEAKGMYNTVSTYEFYLLLYIMYFGFMSNIESLNNEIMSWISPFSFTKSFNNINYCNFMAIQLINFSILYVQIHKVFE